MILSWKNGRNQQTPSTIDLFRNHFCAECEAAKDRALRELEPWATEHKQQYSGEFQKRYDEAFQKYRRIKE